MAEIRTKGKIGKQESCPYAWLPKRKNAPVLFSIYALARSRGMELVWPASNPGLPHFLPLLMETLAAVKDLGED